MTGKSSHDLSPQSHPSPPARSARQVRVLVILIVAAVVSGVAGLLSHAAGNNIPAAVLTAGGAFTGTACLLLAIAHYAAAE